MGQIRILVFACLILGSAALTAQASLWEHYSYGEEVLAMASNANTVLIGTKTGLVKYDINTQQKVVLNKTNSPLPDNWIAGVDISFTGLIVLGTPEGVCVVDEDNWYIFNTANTPFPSNHTYKTMISPTGTLWALSKGGDDYDYLYAYAGGEWYVQYHGNTNIPGQRIQDFTLDSAGNPALVYYHPTNDVTGLAVWNGSTWVNHSGTSMGVTSNYLSRITYDGTKYWMTDGYRIYSWDGTQSQAFDPYLPPVIEHHIISLDVDTQGKLLAGFYEPSGNENEAYLARFDGTNWTVFNPNIQVPGLDYPNAVMQSPDGDLWIGTQSGVARYDGETWGRFGCSNSGLPSNSVNYISMDSSNRLWMTVYDPVANVNALVKKDGDSWTVYGPDTIPNLFEPRYIAAAPDGSVWFSQTFGATSGCVARFDGTNTTSYDPTNSILPYGALSALHVDAAGHTWVAIRKSTFPYETDLCVFDGSSWHPVATTSGFVKDIRIDASGNPWLATNLGVMYLSGGTLICLDNMNSGLTMDNTNCLAFASNGDLWIGTTFGLSKLCVDGTWQNWDPISGNYPLRHYQDILIDPNGKVWGATQNSGLVCFDGNTFTSYTPQNSPMPTPGARNIALDSDDRLWINTIWMGISCFDISSTPVSDPAFTPQPGRLQLANYPNPFNPSTTITFRMKEASNVSLEVYNLRGQRVRKLFTGTKNAGEHSVLFDGRDDSGMILGSGIYLVKASAGKQSETLRVMLMK